MPAVNVVVQLLLRLLRRRHGAHWDDAPSPVLGEVLKGEKEFVPAAAVSNLAKAGDCPQSVHRDMQGVCGIEATYDFNICDLVRHSGSPICVGELCGMSDNVGL